MNRVCANRINRFTAARTARSKLLLISLVIMFLLPLTANLLLPGTALALGETGWEKSASNPIVNLGVTGTWDAAAAGEVTVIKDGTTYKMWYSGQDAAGVFRIGYATSTDGITWTKYGGNPVLNVGTAGTWDAAGVASPMVIKDGVTYKMWFTGRDASDVGRIGYAASTDGITWTKSGANPVLNIGTGWEALTVGSPAVILDSGTYKMWYSGKSGLGIIGDLKIGYATSPDGITWTKNGANPVLNAGTIGTWEDRGVGVASVIKDGTVYKIWYTGYTGTGNVTVSKIGYASSSDGIAWTKYGANPIVNNGAAGTWEQRGVGGPSVLNDSGVYKMWYSGLDSNLAARTGYARIPTIMAGTSAIQSEDPATLVISIKHRIASTTVDGTPVTPIGGLASYTATTTFNGAGVNILAVNNLAPFTTGPTTTIDNLAGSVIYSASDGGAAPQAPVDVAGLVPRLVGNKNTAYSMTFTFNSITTGGALPVTQQADAVIADLQRGDVARGPVTPGTVTIVDALYMAQYLAQLRTIGDLNPINGASVRQDGVGGDKVSIHDAMFIAQMLANLRDASYVLL